MNEEQFWTLIEYSAHDGRDRDKRARTRWLEAKLAVLRGRAVIDFEVYLDQARCGVDTYDMWGAAHRISGFASSDGFFYFQPWLIGLGRESYRRAAAAPDCLSEMPEVRALAAMPHPWPNAVFPAWEELNYVALHAYQRLNGENVDVRDVIESTGRRLRSSPEPSGARWRIDEDSETRARLPRLAALFPRQARFDRRVPDNGQRAD